MTKSPCNKITAESREQEQRIDKFRLSSPEKIAKYAKKFKADDPGYFELFKKLKDSLTN
ncbi:hypothetical protein [Paraburkholderia pallida]|uniref:hypothetical protein n=1 Tax=Paraburkholderia pallida TaxID=2547399 RepID=UPI00142FD294|nr:hypothetical protein [Paraburkholderia pallida]